MKKLAIIIGIVWLLKAVCFGQMTNNSQNIYMLLNGATFVSGVNTIQISGASIIINGVPLGGGGSQTPLLQTVDAATHSLTNAGIISGNTVIATNGNFTLSLISGTQVSAPNIDSFAQGYAVTVLGNYSFGFGSYILSSNNDVFVASDGSAPGSFFNDHGNGSWSTYFSGGYFFQGGSLTAYGSGLTGLPAGSILGGTSNQVLTSTGTLTPAVWLPSSVGATNSFFSAGPGLTVSTSGGVTYIFSTNGWSMVYPTGTYSGMTVGNSTTSQNWANSNNITLGVAAHNGNIISTGIVIAAKDSISSFGVTMSNAISGTASIRTISNGVFLTTEGGATDGFPRVSYFGDGLGVKNNGDGTFTITNAADGPLASAEWTSNTWLSALGVVNTNTSGEPGFWVGNIALNSAVAGMGAARVRVINLTITKTNDYISAAAALTSGITSNVVTVPICTNCSYSVTDISGSGASAALGANALWVGITGSQGATGPAGPSTTLTNNGNSLPGVLNGSGSTYGIGTQLTAAAINAAIGGTVATTLLTSNATYSVNKLVLTAAVSSVTLNIPSGGSKLRIYFSASVTSAVTSDTGIFRMNGDAGNDYASSDFYATGGSAPTFDPPTTNATSTTFGGNYTGASAPANSFSIGDAIIPNYAGTNNFKTMFWTTARMHGTIGNTIVTVIGFGVWNKTNAITSVTLSPSSASDGFAIGSTFGVEITLP